MLTRRLVAPVLILSCCAAAQGPVYKLLYSPSNIAGGQPTAIAEIQPGIFYGLSAQYGSKIFSVTSAGAFKPIYSFPTANNNSVGTMVQGSNGRLYGSGGGSTGYYYYSISTAGTDLQQYPFPGLLPSQWGSLNDTISAPPGQFFDLAGASMSNTTVYGLARIQETGAIAIPGEFTTGEGYPSHYAAITLGPGGNIYGIATEQPYGVSTNFIFSFTPSGTYARLADLPKAADQAATPIPLLGASNAKLYGAVPQGGANGRGEIFEATSSGGLQIVASFPDKGMHRPATMFQAADGNLYGSTINTSAGNSWIFRYSPSTKQLTQIYELNGSQGICFCFLQEGMDGKIYGVTPNGGPYPGAGAIWSLDIGLPKPPPQVQGLYPPSGPVGQKVILWGNYLLAATKVIFNGTPATTFLSTSKQSVQATVPTGATTGSVTVTTANGSFTTTTNFTVQ